MQIEKIFEIDKEKERILEAINSISVECCTRAYVDYLKVPEANIGSNFEKAFIAKLRKKSWGFARQITKKYFLQLEKEGLNIVDELVKYSMETNYRSYERYGDNDEEYVYFADMFSDKEMYEDIKEHMLKTYNELCSDLNKTIIERKKEDLVNKIKSKQESVEASNKSIAKLEQELASYE